MHYFRNFLAPAGSSAECHKLHSSSCLDSGLRDASHMREGGGASATHGSIAVFEPRMYVAACGRVCKNSPYLSNGMQVQKQHSHAPAGSSADCLHSSACLDSRLRDASSHMRGGCHAMGDASSHMKGGCHGSADGAAYGAGSQSLFRRPSLHSTHTFNGLSFANSEWSLPSGSSRCSSVSAATTALPSSP